ncbi:MAG TPA: pentapeptide repeat-containing protein [Gemmataceae bacterium]|nr:pentapeptide repeat-containing protein [Gemmataceae bacterium]
MIGPIKTVSVYVEDQERAVAFYVEKLGFEVRRRLPMGSHASWIEVAPPGAQTCLVLYPKNMMPTWREQRALVVFHCPDVEAVCRRLEPLDVRITMPPTALPWGTFAKFADADGNEFGLTSQHIVHEGGKPIGIEIKHKFSGEVLRVVEAPTLIGANLARAALDMADLARVDLRGVNLQGAELSAADLSGSILKRADLSGCNLAGANLEGSTLIAAVLTGSNLTAANLAGCDLTGCDLAQARLTGANLAGADLSRADLRGADLSRGSLEDATVVGALFDDKTQFPELYFDPEGKGAILLKPKAP